MDTQLDNLIDTLRTEAVERAEEEAEKVLSAARQQAQELEQQSRDQAEKVLQQARDQATHLQEDGRRALEQSARDIEGLLRQRVDELLTRALRDQTRAALSPEVTARLLEKVIAAWQPEGPVEVELSEEDAAELEDQLLASLRKIVGEGVELRLNNRLNAGFRVGTQDEDLKYDFSADALGEALRSGLDGRLQLRLRGEGG